MKIDLEHNPFLIKTHLVIDGENLPVNDPLLEKLQQRLQNWVGDFFYDLREKLGEIAFTVSFKGLSTDLEDLQVAAKEAESDPQACFKIQIKYQPTDSVAKRMEDLKKLIKELSKFDGLSSKEDFIAECEQALDPRFDINLIATMSSGKSTIINSMLGQELLPAENKATTATLVRIANTPGKKSFFGQRLGENEQELDAWQEINEVKLAEWNADSETTLINMRGEIQGFNKEGHASLVLVDTPGPNNSQNSNHGITTLRMIKDQKMSLVLYVIDATKIGVNDDKNLLNTVRETIEENGLVAQDRIIFIVNRIDELARNKNESPLKSMEAIKEYLSKNEIKNPAIIPISAKTTLLQRKKINNKSVNLEGEDAIDNEELNLLVSRFIKLEKMQTLKYLKISPSIKDKANKMLDDARKANHEELEASIHAGIPIVELVIQEYLKKHALPAKIGDTYKIIKRHLDAAVNKEELMSHLEASEEELKKTYDMIATLSEEMSKKKNSTEQEINYENIKDSTKENFFYATEEIKKSSHKKIREIASKHSKENVEKKEAERIFLGLKKETEHLHKDVITNLEKVAERIIEKEKKEIICSYSGIIKKFFDGVNDFEESDIFKNLKRASLSIAEKAAFIDTIKTTDYTYKKDVAVGTKEISKSIWYKPWTWGDKLIIEEKEKKEFVNLKRISVDITNAFLVELDSLVAAMEKETLKSIESSVVKFNETIKKKIDDEINNLSMEVKSIISSKESIIVSQKKHQSKLHWLQKVERRLTSVITC